MDGFDGDRLVGLVLLCECENVVMVKISCWIDSSDSYKSDGT